MPDPVMEDTSPAPGPSLLSLPPELLLENIIPRLRATDIFSLSRTSKEFHSLCKDPSVWRDKTEADFSFFPTNLALGNAGGVEAGWYERVYLGLKKPRTYLWGAAGEARLGGNEDVMARTRSPRFTFVRKVVKPMNVTDWFTAQRDDLTSSGDDSSKEQQASIVDLQAAGWSFAARDSQGGVWVWGKLDGSTYDLQEGWSYPSAIVEDATRLPLPCTATQLATGRRHLVVLDSDNLIWELKAWGKAYHHTAPELTAPSQTGAGTKTRGPHIVQVEAGWDFSACLTATGEIHTWKPFDALYTSSLTRDDNLSGPLRTSDNRKMRWGTIGPNVVVTLPPLPERSTLDPDPTLVEVEKRFAKAESQQHSATGSRKDPLQVVQIACTNESVIALRANGEVWVGSPEVGWQFLPHFSSPEITHLSAQWSNFFAFAASTPSKPSSSVLWGQCQTFAPDVGATLVPRRPLEGLEKLRIIRVVAGDWHCAALTADGAMYTWGQNDQGQCGLSNTNSPINEPTRVEFPPDGDRPAFVFAITAAGMHTGALVLGHARGKDELPPILPRRSADHDVDNEQDARSSTFPGHFRFPGAFRIGFAGRGMYRGPGLGRGRGTS